mmetsp:Transcript_36890/g.66683  ORF Transcript_36890/g.66683 Transcript_36890/m.66683 type:complete len:336 (+) Transcript_36890:106-1113(+)
MGNIVAPMWAECPMLTRLICVGYPAMSLVLMALSSAGLGAVVSWTFTCSLVTIKQFHLWTLFVGPFYSPLQSGMSFLMLLFELYMAMIHFPAREKDLGSTSFLLWMFIVNALMNAVFLTAMFCLAMYFDGTFKGAMYMQMKLQGLWPLIMVCLTLSCLSNPDGTTSFWGMVQIPNKYYPIALTAFFCLLNGVSLMIPFLAALAVGYSYSYLRFDRFMPSRVTADRLEQKLCRGGRCTLFGAYWVSAVSTAAFDVDSGDRRYATLRDFGRSGAQSSVASRNTEPASSSGGGVSSAFAVFGGAGNRLGDSDAPVPAASTEMQPSTLPSSAPPLADGV